MSQVTAAQLKAIAGAGARSDLVAAIVKGWAAAEQKAKLTTRNRASHFLAQIMTETGGLQVLEESGAYRWQTILKIFGSKAISAQYGGRGHSAGIGLEEAKRIAALPVSKRGPVLFNRVYGAGNPTKMREFNNTGPNDGWLYRGGGMMQATGKSNYAAMEKKTGLPLVAHPDLLHQPDSAFMAAYLEWIQDGRCNAAADRDDVVAVRKIINGGTNGLAECRAFLAKAKKALADYAAALPVAAFAEPDTDEPLPETEQAEPPAAPAAIDTDVVGDPDLYSAQKRLKGRHYSPGVLDGKWGSGSAGAISAFRNDSGLFFAMPASLEEFHDIKGELATELQLWEDTSRFRPVSEDRKAGNAATVATVAPEVVPAKRSFLAAAWASVVAFFSALWDTISGYVSQAWDFFTDHKDDVPSDSGFLQTAWDYLGKVPGAVWFALAGVGLALLALEARKSVKKITESVQTGARQ
jgi:predicted chitinase